jgi:branched-chain amino acid transport system permease protein
LLQLLANGLVNGAMFALGALGFGLVYRSTGIFHVAYGAVFVVAGYALYTLSRAAHLALPYAVPLALLLTCLVGCLMEAAVYWPFHRKGAGNGALMIASLGVYIVVENLVALVFGNEAKTVSSAIEPSVVLAGVRLSRIQVVELASASLAVGGFVVLQRRLRLFKAVWAMGDEPELVSVLGLPLRRLRLLVFGLSSLFIAIPACLTTLDVGTDPHVGMGYVLTAAVAVFFGGLDRYGGWVAGGVLLGLLQSLAVWRFSARWVDLVTFGLLILILLVRPQGLMGTRRRTEET